MLVSFGGLIGFILTVAFILTLAYNIYRYPQKTLLQCIIKTGMLPLKLFDKR